MITIDEAIYFIKHCQKMFCWTGEVSSFHDVLTYLEDYKRLTDGDGMIKVAGLAYEAGRKHDTMERKAIVDDIVSGGFDV